MIRFITHVLILSMLTLNIAWAVDACAFTSPANPTHVSLQADDQTPVDPTNLGLACDDWCHAWVGHIALIEGPAYSFDMTSVFPNITYTPLYSSLKTSPPFHPPIA